MGELCLNNLGGILVHNILPCDVWVDLIEPLKSGSSLIEWVQKFYQVVYNLFTAKLGQNQVENVHEIEELG